LEKTYRWKYQVDESVKIAFNNYDCNLIIHTWDKAEIEYHMEVKATLRTEEEASQLDRFLKNLEFSHSKGMWNSTTASGPARKP
jgi:transposase